MVTKTAAAKAKSEKAKEDQVEETSEENSSEDSRPDVALYRQHEGLYKRDGGPYLEDIEREEQERRRARLEGREPDLENPPPYVGDVLVTARSLIQNFNAEILASDSKRAIDEEYTAEPVAFVPRATFDDAGVVSNVESLPVGELGDPSKKGEGENPGGADDDNTNKAGATSDDGVVKSAEKDGNADNATPTTGDKKVTDKGEISL